MDIHVLSDINNVKGNKNTYDNESLFFIFNLIFSNKSINNVGLQKKKKKIKDKQ